MIDEFRECNVLDLGCGAGILGILALQNGASVHFQDYVSKKKKKEFKDIFSEKRFYEKF